MANRTERYVDTLLQGFLLAGGAALFAWWLGPKLEIAMRKRIENEQAKADGKDTAERKGA